MSELYKRYKSVFLKRNLYDREKISKKEYDALEDKENTLVKVSVRSNENEYFKVTPSELSDSEINNFAIMKLLESNRSLNQKIDTMKSIMILWLILAIIGLVSMFYFASHIKA